MSFSWELSSDDVPRLRAHLPTHRAGLISLSFALASTPGRLRASTTGHAAGRNARSIRRRRSDTSPHECRTRSPRPQRQHRTAGGLGFRSGRVAARPGTQDPEAGEGVARNLAAPRNLRAWTKSRVAGYRATREASGARDLVNLLELSNHVFFVEVDLVDQRLVNRVVEPGARFGILDSSARLRIPADSESETSRRLARAR